MDNRKNNKGTKGNKGNTKGYGHLEFVKRNVEKHSKQWWDNIGEMLKGDSSVDKKFAMVEFNKLQVKMIPQDIAATADVKITIVNYGEDNTNTTQL